MYILNNLLFLDKSQVLICSAESWANKLGAVSCPDAYLLTAPPQFINVQTLQVFPSSRRESRCGKTCHYRAMWRHNASSRIKVAVKELKSELKENFLSVSFTILKIVTNQIIIFIYRNSSSS